MSDQNNKSPKPVETHQSVYRRLFPQRAASGWPKDQKPPTREELREALRQFGDAEDLYRPQPIESRGDLFKPQPIELSAGPEESPMTNPKPASPESPPLKYQVICGDNFHYMDESENIPGNQYESADAAIAAAKRIVDQSLWQHYHKGMTADDLYEYYTDFGDDPFIRTEDKSCVFSAWAYADARSKEICAGDQ
jgi:hypothetical protein